jgi:hypothetical protein
MKRYASRIPLSVFLPFDPVPARTVHNRDCKKAYLSHSARIESAKLRAVFHKKHEKPSFDLKKGRLNGLNRTKGNPFAKWKDRDDIEYRGPR